MIVYNPYLDYPNKIRRFLDGKISHMNDEYTDHHKENTWKIGRASCRERV